MESPALSAPTVSQLVMLAAWTCLNDTPPTQKNPLFARFFKNQEELEAIAEQVSLAFTPGLLEVLNSAAPPRPRLLPWFARWPQSLLGCLRHRF